jgi:hypothetical protein
MNRRGIPQVCRACFYLRAPKASERARARAAHELLHATIQQTLEHFANELFYAFKLFYTFDASTRRAPR